MGWVMWTDYVGPEWAPDSNNLLESVPLWADPKLHPVDAVVYLENRF